MNRKTKVGKVASGLRILTEIFKLKTKMQVREQIQSQQGKAILELYDSALEAVAS